MANTQRNKENRRIWGPPENREREGGGVPQDTPLSLSEVTEGIFIDPFIALPCTFLWK
jgi:hypothetical protein